MKLQTCLPARVFSSIYPALFRLHFNFSDDLSPLRINLRPTGNYRVVLGDFR